MESWTGSIGTASPQFRRSVDLDYGWRPLVRQRDTDGLEKRVKICRQRGEGVRDAENLCGRGTVQEIQGSDRSHLAAGYSAASEDLSFR